MSKYCIKCGNKLDENVKFCPNCGQEVGKNIDENSNNNQTANQKINPNGKSKLAGGLLGIFLGTFEVHNFYLGYKSKAITQLLLGTVGVLLCGIGPIASGIWGFIEGILIITGSIKVDGEGNPLND